MFAGYFWYFCVSFWVIFGTLPPSGGHHFIPSPSIFSTENGRHVPPPCLPSSFCLLHRCLQCQKAPQWGSMGQWPSKRLSKGQKDYNQNPKRYVFKFVLILLLTLFLGAGGNWQKRQSGKSKTKKSGMFFPFFVAGKNKIK